MQAPFRPPKLPLAPRKGGGARPPPGPAPRGPTGGKERAPLPQLYSRGDQGNVGTLAPVWGARWPCTLLSRRGPPRAGKREQPRFSRSNSPSPELSVFRADFKTGTVSPPGTTAPTLPRGSESARDPELWGSAQTPSHAAGSWAATRGRGSGLASPPAPAASTAPARASRRRRRQLKASAGGAGARKVAPERTTRPGTRREPHPPRPPRFPPPKDGGQREGEKIPSVRHSARKAGWRGARRPCQLQSARLGRSDAPEPGTRAAGREEGGGEGARAAAALCCIVAAHKGGGGGGPGAPLPRRAGGLRWGARGRAAEPARPAAAHAARRPAHARKQEKGVLGLGGSGGRPLPARAAGSSLARRPRQHNRRAGAEQGSCAAPRRLAGVVVRGRDRAEAAQGRPWRADYMSRPRRRRAPPRAPPPATRPADPAASGAGPGGALGRGARPPVRPQRRGGDPGQPSV